MVKIENKEVMKLNIDYMNVVIKNKDLKDISLKEKVYSEGVGLRINNIERVSSRVMREELKEERKRVLKEMGLSEKEYIEMDKKFKEGINKKKSGKYLSIEI